MGVLVKGFKGGLLLVDGEGVREGERGVIGGIGPEAATDRNGVFQLVLEKITPTGLAIVTNTTGILAIEEEVDVLFVDIVPNLNSILTPRIKTFTGIQILDVKRCGLRIADEVVTGANGHRGVGRDFANCRDIGVVREVRPETETGGDGIIRKILEKITPTCLAIFTDTTGIFTVEEVVNVLVVGVVPDLDAILTPGIKTFASGDGLDGGGFATDGEELLTDDVVTGANADLGVTDGVAGLNGGRCSMSQSIDAE